MESNNDQQVEGAASLVSELPVDLAIDPFNILALVKDYQKNLADTRQASLSARNTLESRLNVSYGTHPDEKLDLFFSPVKEDQHRDGLMPIHLFVHGGYWHKFAKEEYSFVANSIVEEGAIAAVIDYSLMPKTRMGVLIEQVRRAALWLHDHAEDFNGDPARISASGHSAGAHLASYLICRNPRELQGAFSSVRSVLLVSGLFDLEPVAQSYLQPTLAFTEDEIQDWSPCRAIVDPGITVRIAVGQEESQPFFESADRFADCLSRSGCDLQKTIIAGKNHMTILQSLGDSHSIGAGLLRESIAAS